MQPLPPSATDPAGLPPQEGDDWRALWELVNESDSAIIIAGADTCVIHVNAGFTRMFGHPREHILGRKVSETLLGPHTDMAQVQAVLARLKQPGSQHVELLLYAQGGRPLWVSLVVNPRFDADGRFTHVVAVLIDITLSKVQEVLQHKMLEAMARERPVLEVMDLVCREVERIAPDVVATLLAVDDGGFLRPLAAPSLPAAYAEAVDGVAIGPAAGSCGTAAWRREPVTVTDIATDPLWTHYRELVLPLGLKACWSSPIKASDGRVIGSFAFYFREPRGPAELHRRLVAASLHLCALALEREQAKAHIHQLAFYDTLTGLPNRVMLRAKAERALFEVGRDQGALAVLFIDLDRFKLVNDSQGHAAGDELLREVARRLVLELRADDLVGRLSGDEFVAVLPLCGADHATGTGERLLAALQRPVVLGEVAVNPSASIGVAMFPEDGSNMDTLLRHADMAMYRAKSEGRGRLHFFSDDMNRLAQERVAMEAALREALGSGGLRLHYQPQVDSQRPERIHAVEALVRWTHPRFGAVGPARFVPLAEECGLIVALSAWVIDEACRQLADWRRRGVRVPRVAVNVSARDFRDPELPRRLAETLTRYGLLPPDLTLEMTEGTMIDTSPAVLATIGAVHALGIRLAMDDFGTGYSSLSYLHRLPIDELKLDRSFVQDLSINQTSQVLINNLLRIGESLHLSVVAEGVENHEQLGYLAARGCPVVQGYLFSPPLPPDELERWLQAQRAAVVH